MKLLENNTPLYIFIFFLIIAVTTIVFVWNANNGQSLTAEAVNPIDVVETEKNSVLEIFDSKKERLMQDASTDAPKLSKNNDKDIAAAPKATQALVETTVKKIVPEATVSISSAPGTDALVPPHSFRAQEKQ